MPDPTMTNPNEPKISFNIKQPEICILFFCVIQDMGYSSDT